MMAKQFDEDSGVAATLYLEARGRLEQVRLQAELREGVTLERALVVFDCFDALLRMPAPVREHLSQEQWDAAPRSMFDGLVAQQKVLIVVTRQGQKRHLDRDEWRLRRWQGGIHWP